MVVVVGQPEGAPPAAGELRAVLSVLSVTVATICMDISHYNVAGDAIEWSNHNRDEVCANVVIAVDGQSGYPLAMGAPSKGGRDLSYLARGITRFIALMRHKKVCLLTDQEHAMQDLTCGSRQLGAKRATAAWREWCCRSGSRA